jgi:hypothetical protein
LATVNVRNHRVKFQEISGVRIPEHWANAKPVIVKNALQFVSIKVVMCVEEVIKMVVGSR